MPSRPPFALNRIISPGLSLSEFIRFAAGCSAAHVEIRNDLSDPSLLGGEDAATITGACTDNGIDILTVNALQRFNDPQLISAKKQELTELMETAAAIGCQKIVLCPVNDSEDQRSASQQRDDLVAALIGYAPLFEQYEMTGLVEPLGFSICSVRYKRQAADAIAKSGRSHLYQIVHDTFHHHLSGETELFPEQTGLIHASGVYGGKNLADITDDDRLLVDEQDIMDNKGQIADLYEQGFRGDLSFEPFSPEVQNLPTQELQLRVAESMEFLFG
ncbi:MAG: TIM barrel protein [Spirochaetales bacterium]|nr:TIM barrel protein [Spirochaetales bacterium]